MRSSLSAALLLALAAACRKAPPADEAADAGDEEVRPVYTAGAASPLAQQLCGALHQLPADRRAACCQGKVVPGIGFSQCVVTLSAALGSGSVALDSQAVAACAAAQAKTFEGCDWVGGNAPAMPAACQDLLRGARKNGELCRSSLECPDGQTCLGVGPTQAGRCGAPKQDGQACRLAVDALAGYVRQEDDKHHPECAGLCGHYRCVPRTAARSAAAAGEPCSSGTCAGGLRCVEGKCAAPLAAGAACKSDVECLGGCLPKRNVCGLRCEVY